MKELAVKLKQLGFPQPDFKFGQKWLYHNEVVLILFCNSFEEKLKYLVEGNISTTKDLHYQYYNLKEDMYFIPTFQDLWNQLPKDIVLKDGFRVKTCMTLRLQDENLSYVDYIEDDNDVEYYNQYDTDITEAAAKLWILLLKIIKDLGVI